MAHFGTLPQGWSLCFRNLPEALSASGPQRTVQSMLGMWRTAPPACTFFLPQCSVLCERFCISRKCSLGLFLVEFVGLIMFSYGALMRVHPACPSSASSRVRRRQAQGDERAHAEVQGPILDVQEFASHPCEAEALLR